jgi:hypothetical protein
VRPTVGTSRRNPPNRYSLAMPLVRAELASACPSVVLQFLAWLVEYVRRPRRVWLEACLPGRLTEEGWREIV